MSRRRGVATNSLATAGSLAHGASKNIWKLSRCSSILMKRRSGGTEMKTIQIRTEIPGPRSRALMSRREAAVPRGPFHATPIFVASADGATIEDVDGNRYIDFAGGIGCLNVGHRAPQVVAAIREQVDAFLHSCFAVAPYAKYIELAEKLNELTPGKFAKKTIFLNSGAEAVENARSED